MVTQTTVEPGKIILESEALLELFLSGADPDFVSPLSRHHEKCLPPAKKIREKKRVALGGPPHPVLRH